MILMVYPRQVLNRLRWAQGESLEDAVIWYIHRGAPGDFLKITGRDIAALGRGFFDTAESTIPYHRILRIDSKGKTLFERDERAKELV
jgi:uncharacterized protein (UPF0248 family)